MSQADFVIEPLSEADLDTAAYIFAVSHDEGTQPMLKGVNFAELVKLRRFYLEQQLIRANTEQPSSMYPTANKAQGPMRGKVRAIIVRHRASREVAGLLLFELYENGKKAEHGGPLPTQTPYPKGCDRLQYDVFIELIHEVMINNMGQHNFAHFAIAAVSPRYRSSGARAALSAYSCLTLVHEWGDAPSYLEALPRAKKLWKRYYEELEEYDVTAHADAKRQDKSSGEHLKLTAMCRRSAQESLRAYGGERGALAVLVPIQDVDRTGGVQTLAARL